MWSLGSRRVNFFEIIRICSPTANLYKCQYSDRNCTLIDAPPPPHTHTDPHIHNNTATHNIQAHTHTRIHIPQYTHTHSMASDVDFKQTLSVSLRLCQLSVCHWVCVCVQLLIPIDVLISQCNWAPPVSENANWNANSYVRTSSKQEKWTRKF